MRKAFLLFTGLLMFFSCKPLFKVQTEQIMDISRQRYRSFKFFNPENMPESNFAFTDKNKKVIFDAVAEQMKLRGFTSIQESDLIIKIQGGTSRKIESRPRNSYYDPFYGYTTFYSPYYWTNDPWLHDDISKKTTSIIIDVLHAKTKKLMWEGVGTGVLGDKPEQVEPRIRQAINDIFEKFPVQVKTGE